MIKIKNLMLSSKSDSFNFKYRSHQKLTIQLLIINFRRKDFFAYGVEVKFPMFNFCFEYETSNLFDRFRKKHPDKIIIF